MSKLKILSVFLLFGIGTIASAQDVIVKKDGSTVVCRVVEVNGSEVVYKRWSNLNGANYVMNRADVSAINYESGQRENTATSTQETSRVPFVNAQRTQEATDLDLLALDNASHFSQNQNKIRRLRRIGWIGGGVLVGVGGILAATSALRTSEGEDYYGNTYEDFEGYGQFITGVSIAGAGLILGTVCIVSAKKQERSINQSITLYQQDIRFDNGTTLLAGVDVIKDTKFREQAIGLGIRYNF